MTPITAPPAAPATDARLAAFIDPDGPEVFSSVVAVNQVWTPDPFDVDSIHAEAREAFGRLLNRATVAPPPDTGKSLLLLGEAGSGKTHLMRAFRTAAHSSGTGYCGYMPMNTQVGSYDRYILMKLIDALEQPYLVPKPASGLTRLARGLLDALEDVPAEERRRFCDEPLTAADLAPIVNRFADAALANPRLSRLDVDLIRAVLYLLPSDGRIRPRVLKWLRCEDLSEHDRELLGGLVPRPRDEMVRRTVTGLGQLMAAVQQAALILCADQLEETFDHSRDPKESGQQFRRAVDTLVTISEEVPTAVVVVACLEDYFVVGRESLPRPKRERLENDPAPIRLSGKRTLQEIQQIIARRLDVLYTGFGTEAGQGSPTFPFTAEQVEALEGLQTRDVLGYCQRYREACVLAQRLVESEVPTRVKKPLPADDKKSDPEPVLALEQRWNDFRAEFTPPALDDESVMAELLAATIKAASAEMPHGMFFGATPDGRMVPVEAHGSDNSVEKFLVAVCDKSTRGGGLGRQVEETAKRAGDIPAVLVRSTAYPADPKLVVSRTIADLITKKRGRRVVAEDTDWRAMAAFRAFQAKEQADPKFAPWQREGRPLSNLPSVHAILDLDRRLALRPAAHPSPVLPAAPQPVGAPKPTPPPSPRAPTPSGGLRVGTTRAANPAPVTIDPQELTQHAAFLGGPGSGKTTAVLNIIEQLLPLGVPAVLVDRKGDLCRYTDAGAWEEPLTDAARAQRRRALRDRLDVALFTPGSPHGRPLSLPLVPPDLGQLPEADREQLAGYAAVAVGGMMGYKAKGPDPKLAILAKAIEVLAQAPGGEVTVPALRRLVQEKDDALVLAVDGFDDRHYRKLADDLHSLALTRKALFTAADPLDMDALLGRGPLAVTGKTRLSIISTHFLGDAAEFWVAQLLITLDRWRTRNPSQRLQAVFLFDEADVYLPATRQPATKAPLENLLRRARSAGVGLLLATQSPGDLDYRCRDQIRTWLVGRVKEKVALNKLKPMLDVARVDVATKLPGQQTGEFYLIREREVIPIHTEPSLIPTAQLPEDRILELARSGH
jgi:hypothetical protein